MKLTRTPNHARLKTGYVKSAEAATVLGTRARDQRRSQQVQGTIDATIVGQDTTVIAEVLSQHTKTAVTASNEAVGMVAEAGIGMRVACTRTAWEGDAVVVVGRAGGLRRVAER